MKTSAAFRRVIICQLLIMVGCTSDVEKWHAQLGDPDPDVRRAAIRTIEASSDVAAQLPALVHALDDGDASVRVTAALAVQKIDPRSTTYVPVLTESLRAGHGPVFLEVGRMGAAAEWAVPTLVANLSDGRPSIRALAAQTLGEIGVADNKTKSALERSLRDDRPTVRKAAQHALEQIQAKNRG